MTRTKIHFESTPGATRLFRTGVSLHGHTLHSREALSFIHRLARRVGPVRAALERGQARYRSLHGSSLDLARGGHRRLLHTTPSRSRDITSRADSAFFTDSFHEVNGVALTSQEFARFAKERGYPFHSVHIGPETRDWAEDSFETFELRNSRALLQLDTNLSFDLLFLRHFASLRKALKQFRPDLIHVTGPGHCGLLGTILAYHLGIPLVASWHTNLHEFAARRLDQLMSIFPASLRRSACRIAEDRCLDLTVRFYRLARLLFAPNSELVDMLDERTGRPTHLMLRGIDTGLFSPDHREHSDGDFVIGYVGPAFCREECSEAG